MARVCNYCGNKVKNDRAEFCDLCGMKLGGEPAQAPAPQEEKERRRREERPEAPVSEVRVIRPEAKLDIMLLLKTSLPAGILFGIVSAILVAIPASASLFFFQANYQLVLSLLQYTAPIILFILGALAGLLSSYLYKFFKAELLPDSQAKHLLYSGCLSGALAAAFAAAVNFAFPISDIVIKATSKTPPDMTTTIINAAMVLAVLVLTILLGAGGGALAGKYSTKIIK